MTIRVGGPLAASVSILRHEGHEHNVVRADWHADGKLHWVSVTVDATETQALAHEWSVELAAGREPTVPPGRS